LPPRPIPNFKRPQDGTVIGRIGEAGKAAVDAAVCLGQGKRSANTEEVRSPTRVEWLKSGSENGGGRPPRSLPISSRRTSESRSGWRGFEANRGAEFLEACAAAAPQLKGEVLSLDAAAAGAGLIGNDQTGAVWRSFAGITPFNAPVNLLLQKVAPAVAVGNAMVVESRLLLVHGFALRLAELFLAAGGGRKACSLS